jgi:uncharacterized protein involved in exopolysaccharide biosynthesis
VSPSPSAPPPVDSRFGPFGSLVKRVVARLIRFAVYRQELVNHDLDERLRDLEASPLGRGDGDVALRAQYAALSARLTHVQREVAPLRASVAELRAELQSLRERASVEETAE